MNISFSVPNYKCLCCDNEEKKENFEAAPGKRLGKVHRSLRQISSGFFHRNDGGTNPDVFWCLGKSIFIL